MFKAAVSMEQRGMRPLLHNILAIREHHRHARAIFALVKYLFDHEVRRIECHLRLVNRFYRASQNIVAISALWLVVTFEGKERLLVGLFADKTISSTLTGKFNIAERLSC